VELWGGLTWKVPFWPPLLYLGYRLLRYSVFHLGRWRKALMMRTAASS
jgi:hypothetical protein